MSSFYFVVLGALGLTSLTSLSRGGAWERGVCGLLIAAWIGTALVPFDGVHPPWIAIAIDAGVLLVLLYGALFAARRWLAAAAAFQFLIVATHLVFVQEQLLEQWAYVSAYYVWNLALILSVAVGVTWPARPEGGGDGADRSRDNRGA